MYLKSNDSYSVQIELIKQNNKKKLKWKERNKVKTEETIRRKH